MKTRTPALMALTFFPFACCACGGQPQPNPDAIEDTGVPDIVEDTDAKKSETENYVGADKKVDADALVFKDQAVAARFAKLRACFSADATDETWSHFPLRKLGNFVQEDWCSGNGKMNRCAGGSFRDRPGSRWRILHTIHYPSSWPEVFGLGAIAGDLPPDGSWGVRFAYYKGGERIIGEGLHLTFERYSGRESAGEVHLGDDYSYKVEETECRITSPLGQDKELAALVASPESLKTTAVARLDALIKKIEITITSSEARKCVYGPYKGRGIPPECNLTPLTEEEKTKQLGIAKTYIDDQRTAVTANAPLFHRLLTDLIDFEKCW